MRHLDTHNAEVKAMNDKTRATGEKGQGSQDDLGMSRVVGKWGEGSSYWGRDTRL
jgi:hypothetical protein